MNVVVVGLGYVGLPLAELCSKKGYTVTGLDIDQKRIDRINEGYNDVEGRKLLSQFKATSATESAKEAEIIIICVPTPVKENKEPDLVPLKKAIEGISPFLKKEQLLIVESTVNPHAIQREILPILEKTGLVPGKDLYVAHCPERIDPGNKKWNVANIPRVFGALSEEGKAKTKEFYTSILDAEIVEMSSIGAAEAVKMVENSFRDVNIAFVNELAKAFDAMQIDLLEVIKGASTKPFAFMPHFPSCGVGGHCIPVDPYYLIKEAKNAGKELSLLKEARKVNESMPEYTVSLLKEMVEDLKGKNVGLLGIAYKKDVADARESPGLIVKGLLEKEGCNLEVFDPFLESYSTVKSVEELLEKSEYVIICADHTDFQKISPAKFKEHGVKGIVDGKNMFKDMDFSGVSYKGIGTTSHNL